MLSLNDDQLGFEPFENQNKHVQENEFGFEAFDEVKPEEETQAVRHIARTGSRALETLAGMPGDIVNFIKNMSEKLPEVPKFLEGQDSFVKSYGKQALESLPTSKSLKEKSEELTGGYTAPKSEEEQFGDEIASLTTALAFPAKDPTKFKSLLGALGKSIAVKGAGKGVEMLGAEEEGKAATEMGMLFLTGLLGKKTANQYVSEQFKEARSKIPKGTVLPTNELLKGLKVVESDLTKGLKTSTKSEVLSSIKDLKEKASGGIIEADELVEAYHNINEKLTAKKLFDELNRSERKQLKVRYDMFKNKVSDTIKDYGKYNPEFYNQWKDANKAYGTIAQSKKVSNFIESNLGSIPKHLATGIAIELFTGHPHAVIPTLGVAGSIKAGELLYRIGKSSTLQKHYLDTIKAGAQENLPAFIKSLNQLEIDLSKDQDKYPPK